MNPAQDQPQPHINQVRQALLQQLQTLGQLGKPGADGKPLDLEQIKTQVQLANAIKGIADTLVDTARVEVDFLKVTHGDRSHFLGGPPDVPDLPPPTGMPTPHNPFPASRRHTLGDD